MKNINIKNGYDQWNGGGAVAIWGDADNPGQGTFIDTAFSNIKGSAVYIQSGNGTFERNTFSYCEGQGDTCQGAAVYIGEGQGTFIDIIFDNNKAYQGAVFINGFGSFNNCNFTDNEGVFGGAARIMGNVSFTNSRFTNNKADEEGGAVSIVGHATTIESIFEGNKGSTGGALAIYGDDNSFTKTTFNDNVATSYGGAVAIWGNNNTFIEVKSNRNNVTSGVGGALFIQGNDTNIKTSEFDGNIAGADGGAVYILNEGLECNSNIENSNFTNNKADLTTGNGGAVYVKGCTFVDFCKFINNGAYYGEAFRAWNFTSINNTKFDANYPIRDGGAASINGYANITNSNFSGNEAYKCGALSLYSQNDYAFFLDYLDNNIFTDNIANTTYGGAVAIWGQNIQFSNNNLTKNKAVSKGGALYIFGNNIDIINSTLNENSAGLGGAVFVNGTANVINSNLTLNNTTENGGAVFVNGTVTFMNSTFSENKADYDGGVSSVNGNVSIENSTFEKNSAIMYAGAILIENGTINIKTSKFTNNPLDNIVYNMAEVNIDNSTIRDSDSNLIHEYANITFELYDFIYGSTGLIYCNVSCIDDIVINNGNITVLCDDIPIAYGNIINGIGIIEVNNLISGNYTYKIIYIGDGEYTSLISYINTNVVKANSTVNVSAADVVYGENALINVSTDCGDSLVYVNVNGNMYAVNLVNGSGVINITDILNAGNYNFNVTYMGTTNYNPCVVPVSFNVNKANSTINVSVTDIVYGENALINVTTGCEDSLVYVDVNGRIYAVNLVDGRGVINIIDLLNVGLYELNVAYMGTDNYKATVQSVSFNVTKQSTSITAKDATFVINYGGSYQVTVNNRVANVPVTFKLNGKVIGTVNTDGSGKVKINLTAAQLKTATAGKRNLVISFAGDQNHNPSQATVKITINKEATKFISVKSVKSSYMITDKSMQLTATLKDSKNKVIKNQYVVIKVNNKKTFKVKTNSQGVALLTLNAANIKACNINKQGTYKFIVTYESTATYNKTTANGTLKVTK
ncbi:right-handed parallel beta-helix repeat-containing protein [uncultured Methanobrevibacter sp.]|uniref:right-handed parallel beta-helix repeat-containing protein n=1 Tax=uncultured Methanobrevibacter sp. TaxID=253161 RepID=UPI0025EAAD8B|nr:right-handed parallel beta-helix repeat-containing protein [uncultured Methanobrevibacter sp.]